MLISINRAVLLKLYYLLSRIGD